MKLRIVIIGALVALMALMLAAPAYAADKTYYTDPNVLNDETGIVVQIDHVQVSDMPTGYSVFNYPPSQYQFYTLYYRLSNPTNNTVKFQFRINFVDDQGREYTSEEFNLADVIEPGRQWNEQKEFAVFRNSTGVHLRWNHIDRYWNTMTTTNITLVTEVSPTPTVTVTPVVTQQPAVTATATPTPTPAQNNQNCIPFLPMAVIASGFGAVALVFNHKVRR